METVRIEVHTICKREGVRSESVMRERSPSSAELQQDVDMVLVFKETVESNNVSM